MSSITIQCAPLPGDIVSLQLASFVPLYLLDNV